MIDCVTPSVMIQPWTDLLKRWEWENDFIAFFQNLSEPLAPKDTWFSMKQTYGIKSQFA